MLFCSKITHAPSAPHYFLELCQNNEMECPFGLFDTCQAVNMQHFTVVKAGWRFHWLSLCRQENIFAESLGNFLISTIRINPRPGLIHYKVKCPATTAFPLLWVTLSPQVHYKILMKKNEKHRFLFCGCQDCIQYTFLLSVYTCSLNKANEA